MNSNRTAELLKLLDFTQRNLQKVLVFTDSITDVEIIHKVRKCLNLDRLAGVFF